MLMDMQCIDWVNAVLIPTFLALTIGVAVAVYAGVVAARSFAFFQARYNTIKWLLGLQSNAGQTYPSGHAFQLSLMRAAFPILAEFRALGHEAAVTIVASIATDYLQCAANHFGSPFDREKPVSLPESPLDERQQQEFALVLMEFYSTHMQRHIACLSSMKPSWLALFSFLFFPNYITWRGQNIGFFIRRKTWIELLCLRIRFWLRSKDS